YAGQIIWEGWEGGGDAEVFFHDDSGTIQITNNSYYDGESKLSENGHVVWEGSDGFDFEIFLYDGSTTVQLTNNYYGDRFPQINDHGEIVCGAEGVQDGEIFLAVPCTDEDGDGYYLDGGFCGETDCDDADPNINPGAPEGPYGDDTCSDTLDNDCDGDIDDLDTGCIPCSTPADCDDSNSCTDDSCIAGVCEYTNDSDPCDDGDPCTTDDVCSDGVCTGTPFPLDEDEDTYVSDLCGGNDCDDSNPDVNPGMQEIPGNGLDDDCNPATPPYGTPFSVVGTEFERSSGIVNTLLIFLPIGAVIFLRILRRRK
ncbi:MAG: putative metal-binding motif-containing protein, partial [bacterium]